MKEMPKDKEHMNCIIIGHIDHGKSTMMGHVLVAAGAVSDKELRDMEKLAQELDRPSWKFAYFMDRLMEERKRGITIDLAFKKFDTENYYFTIIDAPGHADFVKNMITGASQADCAILVVSAKTSEFASGLSANGQTREHAFLAKTLGVNQLIVALNKFDDDVIKYSEDRYNEVKAEISKLLKTVGYKTDEIAFVPISALIGDNLKDPSPNMPWYKGPTILQALDNLKVPPKPVEKDLRIPVQDVYKIKGAGTVPVGRVETGKMQIGDKIIINPGEIKAEIRSIEMHHEAMKTAQAGDNIGFNLRGVESKAIKRGDVVGLASAPPKVVTPEQGIITQVIVIWHPTALSINYTPVVHLHTAQIAMRFVELQKKMDPKTGETIEENPQYLKAGDVAIVKLSPTQKVCIEKFVDFQPLGRMAVRDMGRTVAVGIVKDII
jgi:elongation factor 1-alpha